MPVVRRSRRGSTSRRSARMPQWASLDAGAEEQVQQAREDRVADVAVQPRHRAGLDVVHAVADHHLGALLAAPRRSAGSRRSRTSGRRRPSRCSGPLRGREPGQVGAAVAAAAARPPRARPRARPARAESSSESLSATTTSPATPMRSIAPRRGAHARLDVLGLVQAGNHDRHQRRVGVLGVGRRGRRACRGERVHRLRILWGPDSKSRAASVAFITPEKAESGAGDAWRRETMLARSALTLRTAPCAPRPPAPACRQAPAGIARA